jgi:farnesyl diphosphate synthase
LNRGLSVVDTVEILKGEALTEEEYFKAAVLGWGVELVCGLTFERLDIRIT